ncbi:MAG: nitroreductase family protein [Planctomycetota bacterium]
MTLKELLARSRSFRRFHQYALKEQTLVELLELARLCPSAANRQPLKYVLAWKPEQTAVIFPHLRWAAALAPWPGPSKQERPTGYMIILGDTRVSRQCGVDCGIVAQTIQMGAAERGLGACMVGSIDRAALNSDLRLPDFLEIQLVIALGKPSETVVLEEGSPDERPYWRDAKSVHHVPKRSLSELRVELPGF